MDTLALVIQECFQKTSEKSLLVEEHHVSSNARRKLTLTSLCRQIQEVVGIRTAVHKSWDVCEECGSPMVVWEVIDCGYNVRTDEMGFPL